MLRLMKGHARNLMTDRVIAVQGELTLTELGRTLVRDHLSGAPVIDDGEGVVGFVSESDLLSALLRGLDPDTTTVRDVMSHPPIVADEFMPTDEVMSLLREAQIHHLPVVRQGRLVGIITRYDVLRYFVESVLPIPPQEA
jgi:CBS domain-containing protein